MAAPSTKAPRKSQKEKDRDRDDQGGDAEGDLEIATATFWIERPRRNSNTTDRGWTLELCLAGLSRVRVGAHVMQSPAV